MRYVEQGQPAYDGIIKGSDAKRKFVDSDGDSWFEVAPDVFAYSFDNTREGAERAYARVGDPVTNRLHDLNYDYPDGILTVG